MIAEEKPHLKRQDYLEQEFNRIKSLEADDFDRALTKLFKEANVSGKHNENLGFTAPSLVIAHYNFLFPGSD